MHTVISVLLGLYLNGVVTLKDQIKKSTARIVPDVGSVLVESHLPHQKYLPVVNEAGEGTVH